MGLTGRLEGSTPSVESMNFNTPISPNRERRAEYHGLYTYFSCHNGLTGRKLKMRIAQEMRARVKCSLPSFLN